MYVIKTCPTCGKKYHVHKDGRIKDACKHIRIGRLRGKKVFLATVDTDELDEMIADEHRKSKK